MPDDKTGLGKPKIEIKPTAKRNLAASTRRVVRPTSAMALTSLTKSFPPVPTMQAEMRKQVLLEAEIRRQRQLQAAIPKTALTAMKFADEARKLAATFAVPRAILEARNTYTHHVVAATAAHHKSLRNMIEIAKQPLLDAWKDQQALWEKQQVFLQGFRTVGMPHIVGVFPDSEPVAIVRGIVDWLRGDKAAGDELEKIVANNLPDALRRKFGFEELKTDKNLHLHLGNENGEIDLAVYCKGDVIFLVEVKKSINNKKISHFINNNARPFIESKNTLSNKKIYGAIAYSNSHRDAASFAKELGLLVCRITESGIEIIEPPNTQQLCDLRSTNLDKPKTPQKHRKKKLDKPDTPHEWISYSKNGDGTEPSFKVKARPTKSCRNCLKKLLNKYEGYRWFCNSSLIAEQVAGGCIIPLEKFVTDVLLGWKNIIVFDDEIIPFSVENATKLFKDLPDLYDDLVLRTYKLWHNNFTNEAVR